jgi:hypothetical protein
MAVEPVRRAVMEWLSMSIDLIVYLPRTSMPTPERWAMAIHDAGFAVDLDVDFDPITATGFRPCRIRGMQAGFEYYCRLLSEQERRESGPPADCDLLVTLVTHTDLRECVTAIVAASVLCHMTDGLLVDPQSGQHFRADKALEWAREQLASQEYELGGD